MKISYLREEADEGLHVVPGERVPDERHGPVSHGFQEPRGVEPGKLAPGRPPAPPEEAEVRAAVLHAVLMFLDHRAAKVRVVRQPAVVVGHPLAPENVASLGHPAGHSRSGVPDLMMRSIRWAVGVEERAAETRGDDEEDDDDRREGHRRRVHQLELQHLLAQAAASYEYLTMVFAFTGELASCCRPEVNHHRKLWQ